MTKLRKAKQNLEATKDPILVMDSLPFGGDTGDTLPLAPHDLDSLAEQFDAKEPEFPSPPPVVSRLKCFFLESFFKLSWDSSSFYFSRPFGIPNMFEIDCPFPR